MQDFYQKHKIIRYFLQSSIILLCSINTTWSQINIIGNNTPEDSTIIAHYFQNPWNVLSSDLAIKKLTEVRVDLQKQGYFDTNYQLSKTDSVQSKYSIHTGNQYLWKDFQFSPLLEEKYLTGTGIHDIVKNNQSFNYEHFVGSIQQIIRKLANDGFPFASLKIDSLKIKNTHISAYLKCDKGAKYFIQDIEINGTAKISKSYLKHYLRLEKGKVYSQKTILNISKKLNEISFLKQTGTPGVRFFKESAQVYVHLDNNPSDQFDVLLGFQPNPPGSAKSFNLIGKAFISLQNNLHQGEKINLNYNSQGETKELLLNTLFPYILDSPFGIEADFSLYSKQLDYLRLSYRLAVQYSLGGENYISTFWRNQKSNILNIDTLSIIQNRVLPNELDYKINDIGLSVHLQQLDYKFNPTKGWVLDVSVSAGNKSIIKNTNIPDIPGLSIDSLYNQINASSIRGELQLKSSIYWPINRRNTILSSVYSSGIFSNSTILENEKYRIGGTQLLRGFNEDQFLSGLYVVGSLEYRFLISQNGFLSAFSDMAFIQSKGTGDSKLTPDIWPLSFGLGFSFETQIGIFQLNYAVGKTQLTPWDLTNGKLHFGYLNIF